MKTIILLISLIFYINIQAQKIVDKIEHPYNVMMKQKACIVVQKKRIKLPLCSPRYVYICKKVTFDDYKYKIKLWDGKIEINDTIVLTDEMKNNLTICKNYNSK